MFKNIRWDLLWEAVKLPLRVFVFTVVSIAITFFIDYFTNLPGQAPAIIVAVLTLLQTVIDKYKHEVNKVKATAPLEGFDRGLVPF